MSDKKRLLNDLRVIDLRAELEKRNLDKSGVRGVLILRLSKHLEEEGHDPATFKFELTTAEAKTPSKRTRRSESTVDEEAPAMEDMIVQDDAGEEEETEQSDSKQNNKSAETEEKVKMDLDEKASRKRDIKDESEATEPKKPCLDKEVNNEDDHKVENNTDAEDSINLDLGDDELLNEETDNTTKSNKKDEAEREEAVEPASDEPAPPDAAPATDAAVADEQEQNVEAAATSNESSKDKDQKDEKDKEGDSEKKEKKDDNKEGGARNLWVSGLSGDTRAKDLKQLCSKHGKVIGAKVVTNARTPGSRCYGYVTMASAQDAESCIKNLHRTELHGRMISVEKAKSESESSSRRQPSVRSDRRPSKERKDDPKENEEAKEGAEKGTETKVKTDGDASGGESNRSTSRTREKSSRSDKAQDKAKRSTRSREHRRSPKEILSFSKIWKERDVARVRERSRAAREEERRRRAAEEALRERERRQRQEKHRLALEREKLRQEREKIEREKNELLRLERERHRLEREKLELERLELKRAQLRLEEERRKRGYEGAYRKPAASPPDAAYERERERERERHKRAPHPPMSSSRGQFEAPPPPRFDLPASYDRGADKRDRDRDYKRDYPRHVSSANMKYSSNGGASEDTRQPMPPGTRPKEPGRSYETRDNRSYRPSPPSKPEQRSWNTSSRYPDAAPPSKSGGGGGAGGEAWSSGESRYTGGGGGGGGAGGGGGGAGGYERYPPAQYQPPPPGATYPDRYVPPRDYARKY